MHQRRGLGEAGSIGCRVGRKSSADTSWTGSTAPTPPASKYAIVPASVRITASLLIVSAIVLSPVGTEPVTDTADGPLRIRVHAATYTAKYRDGDGRVVFEARVGDRTVVSHAYFEYA